MKRQSPSNLSRLKRLLPRFRKARVAVLGDLMLDHYLWGTATRLSPEAPVPVVEFLSQSDCPGGAGNVARNLASLGARVQVFGLIGGKKASGGKIVDDESGAALRAHLREVNIADRGVLADPHRITTLKTRVIARHHQIVRIDRERRDTLSPQMEEKLFCLLLPSVSALDALVLSDYDKGLITDAFADRVLHACHQLDVPVFVKPKNSKLFAYRGARLIVCNTKETEFYLTRQLPDDKSIDEALQALLQHFGCAAVVITRGEKGMSIFEENSPRALHIPAISSEVTYARVGRPGIERGSSGRQVFDVTGAGDTVLSVLALALASGASLPDAAFLANVAAGVVVGKLGTATVTPAELSAALEEV
jgi:D-beta-D-heptose 7-phosphate kinase / D-beta-D-heptose 1-phosphate adenosyltransferase